MASKNAIRDNGFESPATIEQETTEDSTNRTHMGELDKVRNILFGEQIKVYEERMLQIEKDLQHNITELNSNLSEQIVSLDNRIKAQFDEMFELIGKESHNRESQKEVLSGEMQKFTGVLEDFKSLQTDKIDSLSASVNTSLEQETQRIKEVLEQKIKMVSDQLRKEIEELGAGSLSRDRMASLLSGLAEEVVKKTSK